MAVEGKEPDGSMGTDTPLAVLSRRPQLLFSYFHQLFAQVTNPPIDPLREDLVMSLALELGAEGNLLDEHPAEHPLVELDSPILSEADLARLTALDVPPLCVRTLPLLFAAEVGPDGMPRALEALCRCAEEAVRAGTSILILSDRGLDAANAPMPSLLGVSAVHHHLVRAGIRTRTGLVVESSEAREVHHVALLFGYGASAVCPALALETVRDLVVGAGIRAEEAEQRYIHALEKGLLKVMSKMGISTLSSYCGAQVFEAIGIDSSAIDAHFTGTASRIGGLHLVDIAGETLERHAAAFSGAAEPLPAAGEYQHRPGGERHQWNPETVVALQRSVRTGSFTSFSEFSRYFDEETSRPSTLRGLLDLVPNPIALREVEPAQEIVMRFCTGAMSFGSLSREAHETIAVAMNRLGGKSNTGEGGEEPERFLPDPNGDSRRSAIKQVASGRFGVTAHYLVNADVLQIKMAQGSKPGEGGQLPGHKVTDDIARVRHSIPGIGLISPPPHHDIYSIEDLAQLIHDLKHVNPEAEVSVKLVSAVGVGTIAAGVAKAKADQITISGHDGGTGASPLSSIKHAGLPWELGLAEAQQVLTANNLRGRVRLQVDGQLKTGRDVVIAALLGAEEFAFSTAPLVATGCLMMRVCHLNTCPVGIATQDPRLRRKFAGKPEHVINYFFFLAHEVRRLMALLGFRRFDEMVGRSDRLRVGPAPGHPKLQRLDLSRLLAAPAAPRAARRRVRAQAHEVDGSLDARLADACRDAVRAGERMSLGTEDDPLPIRNTDRSVGAMLSGLIARERGERGLPDDSIVLTLRGTAGQSFGAWGMKGVTLLLQGETNDYSAKGLSGARLVISRPPDAGYEAERSVAAGNVALYGATLGEVYIRGRAGERFAVRNSGALAVVEGVGDHGCEYMTGGAVLVLGEVGRNFAAGMSGGTAYVLDLWGRFQHRCNTDMVALEPLAASDDIALVRRMLRRHAEFTGSPVAERVLAHWHDYLPRLIKVMPHDLRHALLERDREQVG
jgi:glutamate synthase domain-containing protein 2/glutamate synthase domain-containing protein 3